MTIEKLDNQNYPDCLTSWLKNNCSNSWDLIYGPQFRCNSRGEQQYFKSSIFIVTFESLDDAILFKLKWG